MKKGWLKKPLWFAIAATATALIKVAVEAVTKINIFSWIKSACLGFIAIRVPLWAAIAVALGLFTLAALGLAIKSNLGNENKEYPWSGFTMMDYGHWTFTWRFIDVATASVGNIRPICKPCGCELSTNENYYLGATNLYCPNCNMQYPLLFKNTTDDVEKVIISKIRNWDKKCG